MLSAAEDNRCNREVVFGDDDLSEIKFDGGSSWARRTSFTAGSSCDSVNLESSSSLSSLRGERRRALARLFLVDSLLGDTISGVCAGGSGRDFSGVCQSVVRKRQNGSS